MNNVSIVKVSRFGRFGNTVVLNNAVAGVMYAYDIFEFSLRKNWAV